MYAICGCPSIFFMFAHYVYWTRFRQELMHQPILYMYISFSSSLLVTAVYSYYKISEAY